MDEILSWMTPVHGAFALLTAALALGLFRLVIGPHSADRVIALDFIAVTIVGWLATRAVTARQPEILDAAIVVALTGFVGTVTFAAYLERSVSKP
jgi:multisubunit Na+/H+ antiporter MnhF subunit